MMMTRVGRRTRAVAKFSRCVSRTGLPRPTSVAILFEKQALQQALQQAFAFGSVRVCPFGVQSNAPDRLDPRMFAKRTVGPGAILLHGEQLPEDLPRSRDPNCELVDGEEDGEEELVLVALRAVAAGEPLTVAAGADGEYEEWELDPATGEVVRV